MSVKILDPFLVGRTYTVAQTAKLAGTSPGTIRNWLFGYADKMVAVLGKRQPTANTVERVSFLELAELIVVARFRKRGIDLERIRDAHRFAKSEWDLPYPFATLNLTTLGGNVLRRFDEEHPAGITFAVLSSPGQYVLPEMVQVELDNFDFEPSELFARRWHPYGREVPIVVDPRFGGGMPTIEGRGVTISMILRRRKAGERASSIASDFGIKTSAVEEVIRREAA